MSVRRHVTRPGRCGSRRRTSATRLFGCATLALAAPACGAAPDGPGADPFVSAPWGTEGPVVRLGAIDDPVYAFGTVRALAVGPDGVAHSLHRGEAAIRRWTPDGAPAGSVGRDGQGPGEFRRPIQLGFFGDTLWVFDLDGYRLSYFTNGGDFLATVRPQVDIGTVESHPYSPPRPQYPLRDGTWIGEAPGWSEDVARGGLTEAAVVHMEADGTHRARVWTRSFRQSDVLAFLREDGGGGTFLAQPFADDALLRPLDDGILVVDRRAYAGEGDATVLVTKIAPSGDTVWHRGIPYTPTPLAVERVDSAAHAVATQLHSFMSRSRPGLEPLALARDTREAMYAPDFVPPVTDALVADDGTIWLARSDPTAEGRAWWVLSAAGEPLARVQTPPGVRIHAVAGDDVWGVETDELDVSYIVRYRLVRES